MAEPEYKETTYHLRGPYIGFPHRKQYWKTAGSRWGDFYLTAPKWLLDYFDGPNWRVDNVRPCDSNYLQMCGEVTIRRPISRMGAWKRRRKRESERNDKS